VAISFVERLLARTAALTSRSRAWHRFPFPIAMATLIGHRAALRQKNLFDTERHPARLVPEGDPTRTDERSPDGSYNDLERPWMGMKGARFGRNVPIAATGGERSPDLYEPNPRLISRELLARKHFEKVPHLNLFGAAWIQFMVHDWLGHGPSQKGNPHVFPLPEGDDWPTREMQVQRTVADGIACPRDVGQPATYRNVETHWWDGSQVYGSSLAAQRLVRSAPDGTLVPDGKIYLGPNGYLPVDAKGIEITGVNGNWWIGLSLLHTLFAREHNAIVDRLKIDHPAAKGEWLFQKARLVNAALMAKIHTVEWTPALMNSPEGRFAMRGNWWGVLGEHYCRAYGRVGRGDLLSGIMGAETDHHGAPYSMTEEFVATYRMHSLLPDEIVFRSARNDEPRHTRSLNDVAGAAVRQIYAEMPFEDAVYSFGRSHSGALVLHNFPNALRKIDKRPEEGVFLDLAAVDILRDRERGVPRYCAMRRHIGMSAPRTFEELTDKPEWRDALRRVYGDVEKVDLLIGTLAETPPPGFGFSDTVFRLFSLMASRRLKSDRFFTTDFTPEVYTPAGYAWVADNGFRSVLTRHCPLVAPAFADLRNVFFPWDKAGAPRGAPS
jgi:hypothetical protein